MNFYIRDNTVKIFYRLMNSLKCKRVAFFENFYAKMHYGRFESQIIKRINNKKKMK